MLVRPMILSMTRRACTKYLSREGLSIINKQKMQPTIPSRNMQTSRLCDHCTEFARTVADKGATRIYHHPDVRSLVRSAMSCSFCHFNVTQLGHDAIKRMENEAAKGELTRVVLAPTSRNKDRPDALACEYICEIWSRYGMVETKRFLVCASKALNRAHWKSSDRISFAYRVSTIKSWLHDCEHVHTSCNKATGSRFTSQMPARFVHLENSPKAGRAHIIDTAEAGLSQSERYIALSHCWGSSGVPLKTSQNNLRQFLQEIPATLIPSTFRDIFEVSRALGISYVWIDSLCIVQDSPQDWATEAAKMAAIFHNAYLTISAAGPDCHSGCGVSRVNEPALIMCTTNDVPANQNDHNQHPTMSVRASPGYTFWDPVEDFNGWPLHSRGWIFQEIILSRRLLHIDPEGNFFWQCHTLLDSEDGSLRQFHTPQSLQQAEIMDLSLAETPLVDFNNMVGTEDMVIIWWKLLKAYFGRKFTVQTDDLPAMVGTIALFEDFTGDTSVVGLWKRKLHIHLAWCLDNPQRCTVTRDENYPSWSWASVRHDSRKNISLAEYKSHQVVWEATVASINVKWEAVPYLSRLQKAVISIRRRRLSEQWEASIRSATVAWDYADDLRDYQLLLDPLFVDVTMEEIEKWRDVRTIILEEKEPTRRKWLVSQEYIPLFVTLDDQHGLKFTVHVLMIKKAEAQFHRIGYARFFVAFDRNEDVQSLLSGCWSEEERVFDLI